MCFIYARIGTRKYAKEYNELKNSFEKMIYRAPDKISIITNNTVIAKDKDLIKDKNINKITLISKNNENPKIILAHGRLSIINNIIQPIKRNNSYLICNGEIYNYIELNKKYHKNNKSDCAIILELYEKEKEKIKDLKKNYELFSNNFIKRIEKEIIGEYSFLILDLELNKILISKDHIGTKPLFFKIEKDQIKISSEKIEENFENINFNEILIIDLNEIEQNQIKVNKIKKKYQYIKKNKFNYIFRQKIIEKLIEKSVKDRVKDQKKVGILFSGGIDSAIIAYYAKKYTNVILYCAGEKDSKDIKNAKEIAKTLELKLKINYINEEKIRKQINTINTIIKKSTIDSNNHLMNKSIISTILNATMLAKKDNIKVLLSGSGADELFLGYKKFETLIETNQNKSIFTKNKEMNKLRKIELENHFIKNINRDEITVIQNSIELRLPFLDKELIKYVININYKRLIFKKQGKYIKKSPLIKIANKIKIKEWKKIAVQYGSNSQKLILKIEK